MDLFPRPELTDERIMQAWRRGYDTQSIAQIYDVRQEVVANRLAAIRDRRYFERQRVLVFPARPEARL
jgi:hypothetical protein